MIDTGSLNYLWSQHLVAGFVAAGVRHAVISPGSRSTPLALAILRQAGLNCEIAVDERCAAFFALGLAKASRQPALLLATSGTAPANWLPAIVEASHAGVPLIALSADRPPELHACGANQTVVQDTMFAPYLRARHALAPPHPDFSPSYLHQLASRIYEQTSWPHPGPVHLNQPFREPLLPTRSEESPAITAPRIVSHPTLLPDAASIDELANAVSGRRGLIVCGEQSAKNGFAEALTALAEHLDCPIMAEPLSGLRFGRHDRHRLLTHYNAWLADPDFARACRPDWVIRFGAYPVTRNLQHYLADAPFQALVEPWPRDSDPTHQLNHLLRTDPLATCQALLAASPAPCPATWHSALVARDGEAVSAENIWHIPVLIDEIPEDSALFIGNSLAIRQFDSWSGSSAKPIHCYGNRGASGIDGNIATALGLGKLHGRIVALLGDLTCQHDLGALALAAGRNVVIIAVNNGGGGIFDHLPQAALPEFELGWRTPQAIRFNHAAAAFGVGYLQANAAKNFRDVLQAALKAGGPWLIELMLQSR